MWLVDGKLDFLDPAGFASVTAGTVAGDGSGTLFCRMKADAGIGAANMIRDGAGNGAGPAGMT